MRRSAIGILLGTIVGIGATACAWIIDLQGVPYRSSDHGDASCDGTVDYSRDEKNCGICGRDCLGGSCTEGKCGAVELATGLGGPTYMRTDDTHVYILEQGANRVIRIPKGGGELQVLAYGHGMLHAISLDATHVFFSSQDGIRKVRKDGVGVTENVLNEAVPAGLEVAVDDTMLYVCSYFTTATGTLRRLGKNESGTTTLVSNVPRCESIALSGQQIFFGGETVGRVNADGSDKRLALGSISARRIALDATHVYAVAYGVAELKRVPRDGGPADSVAISPTDVRSGDIALEGNHVCWAVNEDENVGARQQSGVYCAPKDRSAALEEIAREPNEPVGVAMDEKAVYWSLRAYNRLGEGKVMKRAR